MYTKDRRQSTSRRAIINQTTRPMITSNAAGDTNRFFQMYPTASLVRQMRTGEILKTVCFRASPRKSAVLWAGETSCTSRPADVRS